MMKRKLTRNEIVLIIILVLSLVAVVVSHRRIGDRLSRVWNIYTDRPIESETKK